MAARMAAVILGARIKPSHHKKPPQGVANNIVNLGKKNIQIRKPQPCTCQKSIMSGPHYIVKVEVKGKAFAFPL